MLLVAAGYAVLFYKQRIKLNALLVDRKNEEIESMIQTQAATVYLAQIEGENNERKRIAMELHDRVGGLLAAINLHAENLNPTHKSAVQIKFLGKETIQEIRAISHNLADGLNSKGLKNALMRFTDGINADNQMNVSFFYELRTIDLSPTVASELFKIITELLTNTLKHAQAKAVNIQISEPEGILQLIYDDDGIGFNPNITYSGIGLKNIKARIEQIDGNLYIDSNQGNGTTVIVKILKVT